MSTSISSISWTIDLYVDLKGRSPVQEWLEELQAKDREKVTNYIELLAQYFPWDGKHVRAVRYGLSELRVTRSSNPYRILFFPAADRRLVLVHGFHKKDYQIPVLDLETARKRMEDWKERFLCRAEVS